MLEIIKRLDKALAEIESMTDTVDDGEDPRKKVIHALKIAHEARWENGKLLTASLYKEAELKAALQDCLHLLRKTDQYTGSNIATLDQYDRMTQE